MAERLLIDSEISEVMGKSATAGTPAHDELKSVSRDLIDRAADIGAMEAANVTQSDIKQKRAELTEGLNTNVINFLDRISSKAKDNAESSLAVGGTIALTNGMVVWPKEEELPRDVENKIKKAFGSDELKPKELDAAELTFNSGRVEGALLALSNGGKVSNAEIRRTAEKMWQEDKDIGDKAAGAGRKVARIGGTVVGTAVALPFAAVGGAGGLVIGVARKVGHAITGTNRRTKENLATMQANVAATTTVDNWERASAAQDGLHKQRKDYGGEIGRGIKWGMGLGGLGVASGGFAGNRVANLLTGGRGAAKDKAAALIAYEAGIKAGLREQGAIVIDEPVKETASDKTAADKSVPALSYDSAATAGQAPVTLAAKSAEDLDQIWQRIMAAEGLSGKMAVIKNEMPPAVIALQQPIGTAALIGADKMSIDDVKQQRDIICAQLGTDPAKHEVVSVPGKDGKEYFAIKGIDGATATAASAQAAAESRGQAAAQAVATEAVLTLPPVNEGPAKVNLKDTVPFTVDLEGAAKAALNGGSTAPGQHDSASVTPPVSTPPVKEPKVNQRGG